MQTLFERTQLHEIEDLAIDAGLWHSDYRRLLLQGLPEDYQALLPDAVRTGREWLSHALNAMNGTPALDDGITCPLLVWLGNAARLLAPRPEAERMRRWADTCAERRTALTVEGEGLYFVHRTHSTVLLDAEARVERLRADDAPAETLRIAQEGLLALRRDARDGRTLSAGGWLGGRFLLEACIGEGGYGAVWRAWDARQGAVVALKILHPRRAEDRSCRERFLRGAQRMARLEHRAIAPIVEPHCEDGGRIYIAMRYFEGGDLSTAVAERRITPDAALAILLDVADALQAAHARGWVHRDVKPDNILLTADGRGCLTDFDLVWAADTTGGTDGGLGTAIYAAPEMYRDAADVDFTADVYGLAMTAAFVLHGRPLNIELLREHDRFMDGLNCSAAMREVLVRATRTNPSHRFPSMQAFAEALDAAARTPHRAEPTDPPEVEAGGSARMGSEAARTAEPDGGTPSARLGVDATTSASYDADDAGLSAAEAHALRAEHRQHEALTRRLGGLLLVFGTLVASFMVAAGKPLSDYPQVFFGGLGSAFVGGGLAFLAPWSRWPAVCGGVAMLLWYPVGTVLGVGVLYTTLSPKGAFVLSADYRALVAQAPDVDPDGGAVLGCLSILIGLGVILAAMMVYAAFAA